MEIFRWVLCCCTCTGLFWLDSKSSSADLVTFLCHLWAWLVAATSLRHLSPVRSALRLKIDAQPRTVIGLWKVNLEEPKSHLSDPSVIIHDISTIPRGRRRRQRHQKLRQARIRLASANENDKQQLQWFSNACKGIPQWERRGSSQYTQADIDQVRNEWGKFVVNTYVHEP